ncbi:metallophosphoesterase family protein [Marinisporobacter balticus]|uniref:Nuclease SbcCD subunit D n=1 Tax=Marinisporobacter balticus TaxID=2018667 RepID=A0A4R2L6V8_9FIRM|nr:exonuclease SbcCD subunit D C-terminal domain-containing protein [Marinisporobacter balticus]TCO74935.1 exodeoxyribonuclease I subunit D [Marinisporobacter balticus]
MRILHTSDWHLGKNLENVSRIDEQEKFIDDFVEIVEENNIDMVIIAGDIYDHSNPPAKAEKMFYRALKEISKDGERIILIISGNHDNPERLVAASPLAYEQGIIMLATPKSHVQVGKCGKHKIVDGGEGHLEVEINGERAVILAIPYPSEKRLNEVIYHSIEEEDRQRTYSDRLGELFKKLSQKYRADTINLAVSHLFVIGGEESASERNIQLGGSLAVTTSKLPLEAQYIALGHLHRPQEIKNKGCKIFYAGSPLQYSKSEIGYSKSCYLVDVVAGTEARVEKILFKNYKPIEIWKCENVEHAMHLCRENSERELWVYLEIKTDKYISQEDIKNMKALKKDILEIKPIICGENEEEQDDYDINEKKIDELFKDFYYNQRKVNPTKELMNLFLSIANEEGEEE